MKLSASLRLCVDNLCVLGVVLCALCVGTHAATVPGNVFPAGGIATLDTRAVDGAAWRVLDAVDGHELASGTSDGRRLTLTHAALGDRLGAFVLSAVSGEGGAITNEFRFAFLPPGDVRPCPWVGTNFHWDDTYYGGGDARTLGSLLDMAAAAGIGIVRDGAHWGSCEPSPGEYAMPPVFDGFVDGLVARGMSLDYELCYRNPGAYPSDPINATAFANWAAWVAGHFAGRVDTYDIYNEPWNFYYWDWYTNNVRHVTSTSDPGFLRHFAEFTRTVDAALTNAVPGLRVGVCAGSDAAGDMLTALVTNGIASPRNYASVHPYTHNANPYPERVAGLKSGFAELKALLAANGANGAAIAVTEDGWSNYSLGEATGDGRQATYAQQAAFIARMFLVARAAGAEFACQFEFKDLNKDSSHREQNYGLLDYRGHPKPSYSAVAAMTRFVGDAEFDAELGGDPENLRIQRYVRADGTVVHVVWSVEGSRTYTIPSSSALRSALRDAGTYDLYGNRIESPRNGDRLHLTEEPVYFVKGSAGGDDYPWGPPWENAASSQTGGANATCDANAEFIRQDGGRMVYIYRQSGSLVVTKGGAVDLLLVGGGGGGGETNGKFGGGGGGGGGVVYKASFAVQPGSYAVTVGNGGFVGANGGNTTAFGLTAYGGGAGGAGSETTGNPGCDGASGGGASRQATAYGADTRYGGSAIYAAQDNLGNAGGDSSHQWGPGGGGGAGAAGSSNNGSSPGAGGDGVEIPILGANDWYGGGGAGHRTKASSATASASGGKGGGGALVKGEPQPGEDGRGGGGAGGQPGGSGIMVIAFTPSSESADAGWIQCLGGDEVLTNRTSSGLREIRIFRNGGTLSVAGHGMVDVLAVGGGGGGGRTNPSDGRFGGAGGGGGGVVYKTSFAVAGGRYPVVVGEGGPVANGTVGNGGDTSVFGLVAYGGGAGARGASAGTGTGHKGKDGASGGGATQASDDSGTFIDGGSAIHDAEGNLGHAGGSTKHPWAPGGGGGAGAEGGIGEKGQPGNGGDGVEVPILAPWNYYGGGGAGLRPRVTNGRNDADGGLGGGGSSVEYVGQPGEDGLGGGGAGGARGGSGVVIVSVPVPAEATDRGMFVGRGGDEEIPIDSAAGHEVVRIFRRSGRLTLGGSGRVDVLAVGGGGGGGATQGSGNTAHGGGGGGGGGVVYLPNLPVAAGTYEIVVGEGGGVSTNGFPTSGLGVIAYGGGAGGNGSTATGSPGRDGASGGGAAHKQGDNNTTTNAGGVATYTGYGNLGNAGGDSPHEYAPGGGGGAGAPGAAGIGSKAIDENAPRPGAGGDGVEIPIAAAGEWYGGGGAGFRYTGNVYQLAEGGRGGGGSLGMLGASTPGEDGRGGGGAGGQRGGSGIFIVRYSTVNPESLIILR